MNAQDDGRVRCPRCGAEYQPQTPGGVCPACAFGEALSAPPAAGGADKLSLSDIPVPAGQNSPSKETAVGEPGKTIALSFPPTEIPLAYKPGDKIGRYTLLEEIAEGGMGAVYVAEQETPIRRRVALKVIKLGMDTKEVIARFEAERQALALMDHPSIAKVFDAGATDTGRPYFVMELVDGIPITRFCDEQNLDTQERLKLFEEVCHAIQHAHQKGIIHRDIKPSNILVSLQENTPVPKVIDFGIAKATDQRLTDKTLLTALDQIVGTPAYMSPEQAGLSGVDIDTRSDIYSLGVLLYELLTGKTPFDAKRLIEAGLDEIRRIIREEEPPRPSTKLSTLTAEEQTTTAKRRHTDPPKLVHLVRGDLDWIVMKCLEKDRTRRYGTANDLASDLERHLNHEPVTAVAPSMGYLLSRFLRRHRAPVAVATIVTLLLIGGVTVSTWQAARAARAERLATERAQAETVAKVNAQQAQAAEAKQRVSAEYESYVAKIGLAAAKIDSGALTYAAELLDTCPPHLRHWEWGYLRPLCQPELRILEGHTAGITAVALSPDGKLAATASDDNTARVWETATGKALVVLRASGKDAVDSMRTLTFLPDSRRLITSGFNSVRVWDAYSGQEVRSCAGTDVSVSGNGARFFAKEESTNSSGSQSKLFIRDIETGQEISKLDWNDPGGVLWHAWFSDDGKRLVTDEMLPADATIDESKLTPAERAAALRRPHQCQLWDTDTGKAISELKRAGGSLPDLDVQAVFSPDGKYLVTVRMSFEGEAGRDLECQLWNATTGEKVTRLQTGVVSTPVFSPDSKRLLALNWLANKTASIWDLDTGKQLLTITNSVSVSTRAFTPDGRHFLTTCGDQTARLWDATTGQEIKTFKGHWQPIGAVVISADGKRVLTGSGDKTARLWAVSASEQRHVLAGGKACALFAKFSPDGRHVMASSLDRMTRVWDVATGEPVSTISHEDFLSGAGFSQDSRRVLTVGQVKDALDPGYGKRLVRVSEALTGKQLSAVTNSSYPPWLISPNGRWVAGRAEQIYLPPGTVIRDVGGYNRTNQLTLVTYLIWDAAIGRQVAILKGHTEEIHSANFSPDSTQIATGGDDYTARIWDVASGRELLSLVHTSRVSLVAFSPDGQRIVTRTVPVDVQTNLTYSTAIVAGRMVMETNRYYTRTAVQGAASTFWLWDAAARRVIAALGSGNPSWFFEFTADSQQLLLNHGEYSVQSFNARTGQALRVFKGHSAILNGALYFPDSKRLLTASVDQTAKLWDTETGRELLSLPHTAQITTIAVSPDGKRLLTGAGDGTTILWSADDWKEARTITSK